VAAEAVAFSTKNAPQGKIPLVGMTDAVLVTDQRAGLQVPATGSKAFVMSCRGTGQCEDGVPSIVTVRLYLTSDRSIGSRSARSSDRRRRGGNATLPRSIHSA